MSFVIDAYGNGPDSTTYKAAGAVGYMGYVLGGSTDKHITLAHTRALLAAGVAVGFVHETGTGDGFGGYNSGYAHARDGLNTATYLLGHPARCIYLACDTDTSWASVADYWRGGRDAVGAARLGVYGPRRVVAGALDAGYAKYGWQPEAWSSGVDPRVQLHQHTAYVHVGGIECDYNEIRHADYGQFPFSGSVPVPPVKPPVVPAVPYDGPWIQNAESAFHMI